MPAPTASAQVVLQEPHGGKGEGGAEHVGLGGQPGCRLHVNGMEGEQEGGHCAAVYAAQIATCQQVEQGGVRSMQQHADQVVSQGRSVPEAQPKPPHEQAYGTVEDLEGQEPSNVQRIGRQARGAEQTEVLGQETNAQAV